MVGALSFATQVGWHLMYKGAVMQWQNTSKTPSDVSDRSILGETNGSEYHFRVPFPKTLTFFREKPRKSVKSSAWALASKFFFLT